MASGQNTVDFIVDQMSRAGTITARKMFGEYGIYCDGKMVALVCDDQLFVKPTAAGRAHIGVVTEAAPYKGAKPCFLIAGDKYENADWLTDLIKLSTAELPVPADKRKVRKPR